MYELKRIIKVTGGHVLKDESEIDAFLAKIRNQPKRDVKSLLQGIEIRPEMLQTYKLKLLGTLEVPEIKFGGKPFRNPLYENPDIEFGIDEDTKGRMRPPWRSYHFLLPIPADAPIIVEAQMTVTHGDWISNWDNWLPLVDMRMDRHTEEASQLESRRAELYEDLKRQVAELLVSYRDS